MKVIKSHCHFWRYAVIFLAINLFFFLIAGIISLSNKNTNVWGDVVLWIIYGAIWFLAFIYLLLRYLLLPKVMLEINDEGVIIYGVFRRKTEIGYGQIKNAGLYPSLWPLRLKGEQLVITTKNKGNFVVNFMDDPKAVFTYYKEKFDTYLLNFSDQYFLD